MPFECKKYHKICEGKCCGIIPIPVTIWSKHQHKIQRPIKEKHKVYVTDHDDVKCTAILPITNDAYCPFLKQDLACAIYEDRPKICKKFGDESHWALKCPMQYADGTPRSEQDKIELNNKCNECLEKITH